MYYSHSIWITNNKQHKQGCETKIRVLSTRVGITMTYGHTTKLGWCTRADQDWYHYDNEHTAQQKDKTKF